MKDEIHSKDWLRKWHSRDPPRGIDSSASYEQIRLWWYNYQDILIATLQSFFAILFILFAVGLKNIGSCIEKVMQKQDKVADLVSYIQEETKPILEAAREGIASIAHAIEEANGGKKGAGKCIAKLSGVDVDIVPETAGDAQFAETTSSFREEEEDDIGLCDIGICEGSRLDLNELTMNNTTDTAKKCNVPSSGSDNDQLHEGWLSSSRKQRKLPNDAILKSSLCASAISNSPKKLKCLNDLSEKPVNGQCKHKRLVKQESCSDRARRPEASGNSVQSSPQLLPSSTDNKEGRDSNVSKTTPEPTVYVSTPLTTEISAKSRDDNYVREHSTSCAHSAGSANSTNDASIVTSNATDVEFLTHSLQNL